MTHEEENLYIKIGTVLLLLQKTERLINLAMTYVFQESSPLSLSMLEALKEKQKKRTLGYFITALRKRVDVHPAFDELLTAFLEHRNSFIHNLGNISGFDMDTTEGRDKLSGFLTQICQEDEIITKILVAFLAAWAEQIGISKSVREDCPEFYSSAFYTDIEKTMLPILDDLVGKK